MTRALDPHDRGIFSQDENDHINERQQEILPDTIEGILLRMAEELKCPICLETMEEPVSTGCNHTFCKACLLQALDRKGGCPLCKNPVTKRSLNKLGHLESVIKAYQNLRETYEQETGMALSQAPRKYHSEPQENLTQLYPYAEKPADTSPTAPVPAPTPAPAHTAAPSTTTTATQHKRRQQQETTVAVINSTTLAAPTGVQRHGDLPEGMGLDVFDVDLDSVPAAEAALLAEKMLAIMTLYSSRLSLNTDIPDATSVAPPRPKVPQPSASRLPSTQPTVPRSLASQQKSFGNTVVVKQELPDMADQPTLSLQSNAPLLVPKDEPYSQTTGADTTFVTEQAKSSREKDVILCGTNLTSAKKLRLENIAKALKAGTIHDLATRPTHVVLNITAKQCAGGGGRTVKFFLGLLRGSWVLRFEWVEASMEAGYWVDEEPFLLYDNEFGNNGAKRSRASHDRGEPKLLSGYKVQLSGTFTKPSREDIELMIRIGGGTVVPQLFRNEGRTQDVNVFSTPPTKKHLLVFDQANEGVLKVKKLRTDVEDCMELASALDKKVDVVTSGDLLNCIAQFNLDQLRNTIV